MGLTHVLALLVARSGFSEKVKELVAKPAPSNSTLRGQPYPDPYVQAWHTDLGKGWYYYLGKAPETPEELLIQGSLDYIRDFGPKHQPVNSEPYKYGFAIKISTQEIKEIKAHKREWLRVELNPWVQGQFGNTDSDILIEVFSPFDKWGPDGLLEQPLIDKVIEVFQPTYGFNTTVEELCDFPRKSATPWKQLSSTMIFGSGLVEKLGLSESVVRNIGAYEWRLLADPTVILQGPGGMLGNERLGINHITDKGLSNTALEEALKREESRHFKALKEFFKIQ